MGDQSSGGLASSKRRGADAGLAIGSPPFCDHRSSSSCRFSRRVDRALHTMMARRRSLPPLRAARLVALLCVTSCAVSALHMPNLAERVFSERSGGRMQSIRERGAAWHAQRQQQLQLKVRSHHAAGLQGGAHSRGGRGEGVRAAEDPPPPPSIELAARQFLFDYGTRTGLQILRDRVQDLQVPDVSKTFNLPLVGDFKLDLSSIHVVEFNASSDDARFSILDGNFDLRVTQVDAQIQFQWHWEKLGMQGTGEGELDLHGGSIDFKFRIGTNDQGEPLMLPDDVTSRFSSVELHIRSFSADWLYQAVMSLFNEQIQRGIQNGIANALQNDVPNGINKVLATLPTRVDVQGLPFSAEFQWSLYDLTFVMVKGYGMVDTGEVRRLRQRRRLQALAPCPFPSSALPLSAEQIAAGGGMVTLYLHQSMVNCLSWGLFTSNLMQFDLVDGTIPKLHLTTDLLAMLIPGLPKAYPHQFIRITGEALTQPIVAFDAQGFTLTASYRTSIYVANETAGNPKIVTMAANLTVQGQLNYDTTIITSAVAQHTVEESAMPVSAPQWDATVAWFITNYAGLYPLQFLIEHFVQTPVTSLVSLVNAQAATYDGGWYALSGDVLVHPSR